MSAGWIITLIASVFVCIFLMVYLFPNVFLKTGFVVPTVKDRGLKNIKETTGRTIVYQPSLAYRKYIPQYLISDREGERILLCKIAPNVKYIDYDVVMFDGANNVCRVVNAKELIENEGYTEKMSLDKDVAYVSIVVNEVNEEVLTENKTKPIVKEKIVWYSLACALTTFLEILLIKVCCSSLFGEIFKESFMVEWTSVWLTVGVALASLVVHLAVIFCAIYKNNRVRTNKGEM